MSEIPSILYGGTGQLAALLKGEEEIFIVYDSNVSHIVANVLDALTPEAAPRLCIALEASEENKTVETVIGICRELMEAGASRGALILAVGGGITLDIAGFAAGIYKRGVRYASLPTTLLAQVDASIGGKTGVNLDGYKNIIGAFHMPQFTFILEGVLESLPAKEMRCGLAELAKTFLIGDENAYRVLVSGAPVTPELIARAAEIKAGIVSQDPYEKGPRAVLNLGHTYGHAIEYCSGGSIPHGDAVAMGIILAAKKSLREGIADPGFAEALESGFRAIGLPVECPFDPKTLSKAMQKDKKAAPGKIKLILPVRPGKVIIKEYPLGEQL